jgi:hypothetical protein
MSYESDRETFKMAIKLGWPGKEPLVLGTYEANQALERAERFLEEKFAEKHSEITNRMAHEEAAGMGLCHEFFDINKIDPDAPYVEDEEHKR